MIEIEALVVPTVISGATESGTDITLTFVGARFQVSKDAFSGDSALFDELKLHFDAGDISVYVDGLPIASAYELQEAGGIPFNRKMAFDEPHRVIARDPDFTEVHEWIDDSNLLRRKVGSGPATARDGLVVGEYSAFVVRVGEEGDYTTVGDAIAAIVAATSSTPYIIEVAPGVYLENNPVNVKGYIKVVGSGRGTTRLVAVNAAFPVFRDTAGTGVGPVKFEDLSIEEGTIGVDQSFGTTFEGHRLEFVDQSSFGVRTNHVVASTKLNDTYFRSAVNATGFLQLSAGLWSVTTPQNFLKTAGTMTSAIAIAGGSARIGSFEILRSGGTLTSGVSVSGGSSVELLGKGVVDGADNGFALTDATNEVVGSGPVIQNSGTYDINFTNGDANQSLFSVNAGTWNDEKVNGNPTNFRSVNVNMAPGRRAHTYTNPLSVGRPGQVRHNYIGQGAPHSESAKVFRNDNLEVGTWTDITDDATDISGGPAVAIFDGLGINRAIYFGSSRKFFALETQISTALNLGAGEVLTEFWDGAVWVEFKTMAAKSTISYDRHANAFLQDVETQSIRFDQVIDDTWAQKALNGSTRYWVRFVITGAITTDPIIEGVLLYPNTTRITGEGSAEYFGHARKKRRIPVVLNLAPAANAPSNTTVTVAIGIDFDGLFLHPDAADTYISGQMIVESWMDTSSGLVAYIDWKRTGGAAGDVDWELSVAHLKVGEDESVLNAVQFQTKSTTVGAALLLTRTTFDPLDISDLLPRDVLVFKLRRLGNADTFAGSVIRRQFYIEVREAFTGES